jgi:hypothetical protein
MSISKRRHVAQNLARETITLVDIQTGEPVTFARVDFEKKLVQFKNLLAKSLDKIATINDYSLDTIQLSIGVSAGWLVVTFEGGVTLVYNRKSGSQKISART